MKTPLNSLGLFNVIAFNGNVKQSFFGAVRIPIEKASAKYGGKRRGGKKATNIKIENVAYLPKAA